MDMTEVFHLDRNDRRYPESLRRQPPPCEWDRLTALGNPDILQHKLLGLFCSVTCPGSLVLQTYDLAQVLRDAGVPVIGGFHTPVEKECLDLMLRGSQPVVICPARGLERMRIPAAWRTPLTEGRLLILSPFGGKQRRASAALAARRNAFISLLADRVLVAYAASGGKTEAFCRGLVASGKTVLTLENEENMHLVNLGAQPVQLDAIGGW